MTTDKTKVVVKYLRVQPINGRAVAFAQMFNEDGSKLFPDRTVDVPLVQILQIIVDEDYELINSFEMLDKLIRINGFAS